MDWFSERSDCVEQTNVGMLQEWQRRARIADDDLGDSAVVHTGRWMNVRSRPAHSKSSPAALKDSPVAFAPTIDRGVAIVLSTDVSASSHWR